MEWFLYFSVAACYLATTSLLPVHLQPATGTILFLMLCLHTQGNTQAARTGDLLLPLTVHSAAGVIADGALSGIFVPVCFSETGSALVDFPSILISDLLHPSSTLAQTPRRLGVTAHQLIRAYIGKSVAAVSHRIALVHFAFALCLYGRRSSPFVGLLQAPAPNLATEQNGLRHSNATSIYSASRTAHCR